ncbi:MAG: DegT/DnrJ/EryC1/StrS family aminotransferase [bacterium]
MPTQQMPFGTMVITQKSRDLVNEILDSKRVSCGKYVRQFEERFAELVGTEEAVAVSSGADADALALAVLYDLGAKRDDEVIVPALSFVATGNAVLQAGFKPVFVDIERETLNIDPHQIEQAITTKTRAIMPVHLMGKPAEMDTINEIARRHHLYVVEDAAEAHGARYKSKNIGTLGDMAAYSLYLAHMITTIEGGVITTNHPEFAEVLRSLRSHGRACKCKSCVLNLASAYCPKRFEYGEGVDLRFIFERIGFSCKMNEIEAAVGLGSLEIYDEILRKRKKNFATMSEKFKRFDQYFVTIKEEPYEEIGPHAFPIVLKEGVRFSRDHFVDFLEKNGIETRSLFASMPTQCQGFKFLGYKLGEFPEAEYIGNNGLHIGVHQDIDEEQIDYFIEVVDRFLEVSYGERRAHICGRT